MKCAPYLLELSLFDEEETTHYSNLIQSAGVRFYSNQFTHKFLHIYDAHTHAISAVCARGKAGPIEICLSY